MNGNAKETAPLFLFIGECVTSEANGRGHPQECASSSWQPFSTPSSAEPVWGTVHPLPLLPRLPPASISHSSRVCHPVTGAQAHPTVSDFLEQPPLIHRGKGVMTKPPKHRQTRTRVL